MAKRVQFTENDLRIMKDTLLDVLIKMQEDLATTAEKSTVIIPLFKIEQLLEKAGK